MKKNKIKKKKNVGMTLVESLIAISLVSMVTMSIYMALGSAVRNMGDSKQRSGAVALANEQMEIFRNLDYSKVGIIGGIVEGQIKAHEEVNKNGSIFNIYNDVRYIDDPFDGQYPNDPINTDFKRVMVKVTWENSGKTKEVTLYSNFVPNGIETNEGGGTLAINLITSAGEPVGNGTVRIESVDDNPKINYQTNTDELGNLVLPGVPAQRYRITVTKDGYETVRTYPNPPDSPFIPIEQDYLVVEDYLNMKTFFIDKSADITIRTVNVADDGGIYGVGVSISGGRLIGSDPTTYNFEENDVSDSSGEIHYSGVSPGVYDISNLDDLNTDDYQYLGSSEPIPFSVNGDEERVVSLLFARKNIDSLVVRVTDGDELPIEGASVRLFNGEFNQTVETEVGGIAFFPIPTDPPTEMVAGDYQLEISKDGFSSESTNVEINDLTRKDVTLEAL